MFHEIFDFITIYSQTTHPHSSNLTPRLLIFFHTTEIIFRLTKKVYPIMSTSTSSAFRIRPIVVTANLTPSDPSLSLVQNVQLLSESKLLSGACRKFASRRVSAVLHEAKVSPTETRRTIACFESPIMEVVYPMRVQESKFGPNGTILTKSDDAFAAAANSTAPPVAAAVVEAPAASAVNADGTPSAPSAAAPKLYCNAVLRCCDPDSISAMSILDDMVRDIFPAQFLVGFHSNPEKAKYCIESLLSIDEKNSFSKTADLIKMDVPFDPATRALLIYGVDENNHTIEAPINQINSGSRVKCIFTIEMLCSDKPTKRVHMKLALQQIAIIESNEKIAPVQFSLFQTIAPAAPASPESAEPEPVASSSSSTVMVDDAPVPPPVAEAVAVTPVAPTARREPSTDSTTAGPATKKTRLS